MATITKNVVEPAPPPPVTVDVTGLTVEEYVALWDGLWHLLHGSPSGYSLPSDKRTAASKLLNHFVSNDPRPRPSRTPKW